VISIAFCSQANPILHIKNNISMMKNSLSCIAIVLLLASCKSSEVPLRPYGAIPSQSQLEWQKMEYYMFVHFGPNTFTDVEWGNGKEDPKVFNPKALDCRQWAATAKAAGLKAIIITAKHHDGFCLWPSKFSMHTVRESGWKNGTGDVLRELSDACREYGLKFGVYLSPWDRNHPAYGTPDYNQLFANTLNEVLSSYGEVFEQWFDGANGDGTKRQVYDWPLFQKTVFQNQPQAIIFSDIGPGCRWMGNEQGVAGETNWSRLFTKGFEPGSKAPSLDTLNRGNIAGTEWIPAETDVSIRPGWFYSPSTNEKVKSVEQLSEIYYNTVGRNSNLLLNVPADRSGRIHSCDSIRLIEFRRALDEVFTTNLAQQATITASSTRGKSHKFAPSNLLDNQYDTYWATDDTIHTASLVVTLKQPRTFNRLLLQEYIPLGQRVASFNVEYWDSSTNRWHLLSEATTIGYKRILQFADITTTKLRINILQSLASPVLNNLALYFAPEHLSSPTVVRTKFGMVSLLSEAAKTVIYYTLDGSEPTTSSAIYTQPFALLDGATVKAMAALRGGAEKSEVATVSFDVAPSQWKVIAPQGEEVAKAIDGDASTSVLLNQQEPLVVDFGSILALKGFYYVPVNDVNAVNLMRYNCAVSMDGKMWIPLKNNEIFNNIKNNPVRQEVSFRQTIQAKFIKIEPLESVNGAKQYAISELGIITR